MRGFRTRLTNFAHISVLIFLRISFLSALKSFSLFSCNSRFDPTYQEIRERIFPTTMRKLSAERGPRRTIASNDYPSLDTRT